MITTSRNSALCHIVNLRVTPAYHSQSSHSIEWLVSVTETDFEDSSLLAVWLVNS